MINVLARATVTRNNFVDKGKKANLSVNTSQNFALVCMRFLAFTASTSQPIHRTATARLAVDTTFTMETSI